MSVLTTFHLSAECFSAIKNGQREALVLFRVDVHFNESVRLCCDETKEALEVVIKDVSRHDDAYMTIRFDDIIPIDYDICD